VVAVIRLLLPEDKQALADRLGLALGDLFAELIGRSTAMSASVITPTLKKVENFEKREQARYERLRDLERTVNGRVDTLWQHYEQTPDLAEAVHRLAVDVEQLKQRQVNDDASNPADSGER
jgi:hypothetical protein